MQEEVEEKRRGGLFAERGLLFRGVEDIAAAATMLTRARVDRRSKEEVLLLFLLLSFFISPTRNSQTSTIY